MPFPPKHLLPLGKLPVAEAVLADGGILVARTAVDGRLLGGIVPPALLIATFTSRSALAVTSGLRWVRKK